MLAINVTIMRDQPDESLGGNPDVVPIKIANGLLKVFFSNKYVENLFKPLIAVQDRQYFE